ncbi:holo-ACP synthase [Pseudobacillus badius]|uniref:holo-ACP synthase n=1 Tax=Bacillus badius TaxID=1455 RepID=UPI0007B040B3|nr:holo-ACP synthase [Bacillus badius]KZO00411.1 holo-ACP synthase [Bacillus badius]OCS86637.1 holo-ACP synthase [Bacillus badius]OVE51651.1 holo-ACP synthase [Bacillus badius]TDW02896.1 holo-[acyl-carrier-protein] synthase [Bacillus badius]
MIQGIGMDIVEISRIQKLIERQPKFIERILTKNEQLVFHSRSGRRQVEYLSGRFAAKEAFAKAMGSGIGGQLSFQDIETASDSNGKPCVTAPFSAGVHLSITHSKDYAAAQVVIEQIN